MRAIHEFVFLAPLLAAIGRGSKCSDKPNIVLILTDDQDRRLGSTDYQKKLHSYMMQEGTEFINHWGTLAQCCPSRASLLRGQAGHNTNITNVFVPGYIVFRMLLLRMADSVL
jgi:arylsulfatase A-like enzyme